MYLLISLNYNIMKPREFYVVNGVVCTSLQSAQELKQSK